MRRRVTTSTMRPTLFFAALFAAVIAFPAAMASARQSKQNPSPQNAPAALPSETVWFAARGTDGQPVSGLSRQDFQVFVHKKPQQIVSFSHAKSAPLVVGLLMQVSGMRYDTLPYEEIKPAMKFFQSIIHDNDEGFAATFKDNVHSLGAPTSNLEKLERDVRNARRDYLHGPSALFDAILWACEKRLAAWPGTQKALVIVADGHDNSSRHGPEDAVEAALQTGTHIYFVSLAYANDHVQGRRRRRIIHNDELIARDTAGALSLYGESRTSRRHSRRSPAKSAGNTP
jgi:VWFA-related protein